MSYGKDERHVDKHLWKLPIPHYDETNPQHRDLADLGQACAEHVKTLDLDEGGYFVTLRRRVRSALAAYPPALEANTIVVTLLARASDPSAPAPSVPMQRRGDELLTRQVDPVSNTTSVAARKTQS